MCNRKQDGSKATIYGDIPTDARIYSIHVLLTIFRNFRDGEFTNIVKFVEAFSAYKNKIYFFEEYHRHMSIVSYICGK